MHASEDNRMENQWIAIVWQGNLLSTCSLGKANQQDESSSSPTQRQKQRWAMRPAGPTQRCHVLPSCLVKVLALPGPLPRSCPRPPPRPHPSPWLKGLWSEFNGCWDYGEECNAKDTEDKLFLPVLFKSRMIARMVSTCGSHTFFTLVKAVADWEFSKIM